MDLMFGSMLPKDRISGNILDYYYDFMVKTTSITDKKLSITSMTAWKILTHSLVRYPDFDKDGKIVVDRDNSSNGSQPHINSSGTNIGGHTTIIFGVSGGVDDSKREPTAKASVHFKYLANILGLEPVIMFDDFTPSNGCANQSATCIDLISNFFSWSKEIPWHQINVFIRDKKIYALRDVTAVVDSIPLIASSIMSKKIAAGADVIVLDVETGSGAFMKTPEKSLALAKEMVKIGCNVGKKTMAVVSNMDEPLGYAVGNALEVKEAIDTLNGEGPTDLLTLCIELGSHMIMGAGLTDDKAEAGKMLREVVDSKKALNKLAEFVEAQGGDKNAVYNKELLPKASIIREFVAKHDGYVSHIECDEVGKAAMVLGGGRENKDSIIDLSVGIVLHKKVGDFVRKGENIATFHANDEDRLNASLKCFENAYVISDEVVHKDKLIQYIVTEEGVTNCE